MDFGIYLSFVLRNPRRKKFLLFQLPIWVSPLFPDGFQQSFSKKKKKAALLFLIIFLITFQISYILISFLSRRLMHLLTHIPMLLWFQTKYLIMVLPAEDNNNIVVWIVAFLIQICFYQIVYWVFAGVPRSILTFKYHEAASINSLLAEVTLSLSIEVCPLLIPITWYSSTLSIFCQPEEEFVLKILNFWFLLNDCKW